MASVVIGYKNLCLESGVTFTESGFTEDAAHPTEALAQANPVTFMRVGTLTDTAFVPPSVTATFPGLRKISGPTDTALIVPLYAVSAPHQNLIADGIEIDAGAWTELNCTNLPIAGPAQISPPNYELTATGGGAAIHSISQSWARDFTSQWDMVAEFYAESSGASSNVQIQIDDGTNSNYFRCNVNLSAPSIQASAAAGAWTLTSASVDANRIITLSGSTDGTASPVRTTISILDSSYALSFAQAGEAIKVSNVSLVHGTSAKAIQSRTSAAGYWGFAAIAGINGGYDASSELVPLSSNVDNESFFASRGWTHAEPFISTGVEAWSASMQIYFADVENAAGQLDISNIYIGPALQPSQNFMADWDIVIDPVTGGRILNLTLDNQSKADAYGEYLAMAIKVGVGSNESTTASGGQEYRHGKEPILVILDPDETTYGQEQMIYGYLDSFQFVGKAWNTTQAANVYRISMTVSEVMK